MIVHTSLVPPAPSLKVATIDMRASSLVTSVIPQLSSIEMPALLRQPCRANLATLSPITLKDEKESVSGQCGVEVQFEKPG
jgi:2-phospho-L-lactate transferase/gluconeogenesis factor (CofD/UPF0052 family)